MTQRARYGPRYGVEEVQKPLVSITEALAKHQAADHIGHSAAWQERWVKTQLDSSVKGTNQKKKAIAQFTEDMFLPTMQTLFKCQKQNIQTLGIWAFSAFNQFCHGLHSIAKPQIKMQFKIPYLVPL